MSRVRSSIKASFSDQNDLLLKTTKMNCDMLRKANLPVELMTYIAQLVPVEYRTDVAQGMGLKLPKYTDSQFTYHRELLAFNFAADLYDVLDDEAHKWPSTGTWEFIATSGRKRISPKMFVRGRSYEPYNKTARRDWFRQEFKCSDASRRQYRSRAMEVKRVHGFVAPDENFYFNPLYKRARLL